MKAQFGLAALLEAFWLRARPNTPARELNPWIALLLLAVLCAFIFGFGT